MAADSISFLPLYVIFHDQWAYRTWEYNINTGWMSSTYPHRGHCHFFMMGHNPGSPSAQKAYSGSQIYKFEFQDVWTDRSNDPNQTKNLRIISSPKWYFYTKEYWRRVYVQPWDCGVNTGINSSISETGIKWDASIYNYGPYREGLGQFFYWNNMSRTLPIEYFKNDLHQIRDHYLRTDTAPLYQWNLNTQQFDDSTEWLIPRTYWAGTDGQRPNVDGPEEDNPARRPGYSDQYYAYPTIEYQVVEHLQWERLPGWEERDASEDVFGDGFETQVSFPYKIDGVIQSPFSDDEGNVSPPGGYHHNFDTIHPERVLRYPETDDPDLDNMDNGDEWRIPEHLKGQPVQWSVPSHMQGSMDGMWVEQCLGGIVRAKAKVTVEDNFGGRKDIWVTGSQFMVRDDFAGTDQNVPAED